LPELGKYGICSGSMNGYSWLRPLTMRRASLYLVGFAAFACSESEGPAAPDSGSSPPFDAARQDNATSDAALDIASDVGGGALDAAPGDAVRDGQNDGSTFDATFVDALPRDALPRDALADGGDPAPPRFSRIGKYTITIPPLVDGGISSSDSGVGDAADVYYPDPPDLHTATYSFPIVLLFQGAKVARGFYSSVAAQVAGYGFVVVIPDHLSNNLGGPGLYAELAEIAAVNAQMKVEAASTTAPLRGVVDNARIALMGHSYGGASGLSGMANMCFPPIPLCTFTRPPELVGGAFFGTNLATPILGVPALDTGGLPVLLVQGDKDGKALPPEAQLTYDQLQKRPKAIISLLGANHYGITDVDNPAGADPEVNAQTLDHATGIASTGRWIGVFFSAFLNGDLAARAALRQAASLDSHISITLAE
jgi:dienelactone hydrolase